MRIVGRILIALVLVVAVLLGAAYLLPREVMVETSVDIVAPPDAVFPFVSDLREFAAWAPWTELDPAMEVTYSGPDGAAGQTMTWQSENPAVGSGSMTIRSISPGTGVDLDIAIEGEGSAEASLQVEPLSNDRSRVTWTFTTDLGNNPIWRYFWPLARMSEAIEADYDRGLERLKEVVEAQVGAGATPAGPALPAAPPPP